MGPHVDLVEKLNEPTLSLPLRAFYRYVTRATLAYPRIGPGFIFYFPAAWTASAARTSHRGFSLCFSLTNPKEFTQCFPFSFIHRGDG